MCSDKTHITNSSTFRQLTSWSSEHLSDDPEDPNHLEGTTAEHHSNSGADGEACSTSQRSSLLPGCSIVHVVSNATVHADFSSSTVGTPGLGYPLLLCLGKGLVVILGYVQTAGPLWSGVLFSLDNGPGPVSRLGKVRERRVSRERRALSPSSRGSGPPVEPGPPRKSRTPDGVPDHLYSNRTPR